MFTGLGAALIGGAASLLGGASANRSNAKQAAQNRAFQADMSNTAHQREVHDLKLAGLNPILSATGGSGASTPSGSVAQMQDALTPAVSTALQTKRLHADLKQLEAQTALTRQDVEKSKSATWLQDVQSAKTREENKLTQLNQLLTSQTISNARAVGQGIGIDNLSKLLAIPQQQTEARWSKSRSGQFFTAIDKMVKSISPLGHSAKATSQIGAD